MKRAVSASSTESPRRVAAERLAEKLKICAVHDEDTLGISNRVQGLSVLVLDWHLFRGRLNNLLFDLEIIWMLIFSEFIRIWSVIWSSLRHDILITIR